MPTKELQSELTALYSAKTSQCINLENSDNPQVVKLHDQCMAEADILNAILSRIEGDRLALKLL